MTLSDLAKYSVKQSITRPVGNSWASCSCRLLAVDLESSVVWCRTYIRSVLSIREIRYVTFDTTWAVGACSHVVDVFNVACIVRYILAPVNMLCSGGDGKHRVGPSVGTEPCCCISSWIVCALSIVISSPAVLEKIVDWILMKLCSYVRPS